MSFTVTIKSTQEQFQVKADESILEAALNQGLSLPYGCRDGACGSCKGKVLDGEVAYLKQELGGISAAEMDAGYALFCMACPKGDLEIDVRTAHSNADIKVRKLPCRVIHLEKLNHDVMRILLKLPKTERLQFLAGQYIDIILNDGKHRSFSLANAPHDDEFLELHVRYYPGGIFSEYAFENLQEKTLLRIEGPLGSFYFRETSERPILIVAGGTGFAPVKSIIEHILASKIKRPIKLYWGARAREDLYLNNLAQDWADTYDFISYIPVLSEPLATDHWQGRTGLVHEAVLQDITDLSSYEVYTCGPPPMTKAVCEIFAGKGLDPEFIYSDSFEFAAKTDTTA